MASEDAALEAVVRPILAGLKTKFGLSDAHCALIAKDIEEIANEPADRRNQIIQQIEKEIAHSVSWGGRRSRWTSSQRTRQARLRWVPCVASSHILSYSRFGCCAFTVVCATCLLQEYAINEQVGSGAFGSVFKGSVDAPLALARACMRSLYLPFCTNVHGCLV